MEQKDAMALLSGFVTLAGSAIGWWLSEQEEKERNIARNHVIDVYTQDIAPGEARTWFRKVLPPQAPREFVGGRMWTHHPVAINGEMYLRTSTSPDGVYVVTDTNMVGYIDWDDVSEVYVSMDTVRF